MKFRIKVRKIDKKKDPGLYTGIPTPKTNKPYLTKTYLNLINLLTTV